MSVATGQLVRVAESFDAVAAAWNRLEPRSVFGTYEWQRAWWESFGRGQLLLVSAERAGRLDALAPLFADSGMVFFAGAGGSDYLDVLGTPDSTLLADLLGAAADAADAFVGIRLHHLPDSSPTAALLPEAAERLGLSLVDEGSEAAPALDLAARPDAAERTSLVRRERWFRREGELEVEHLTRPDEIAPHLDEFFGQHVARWAATPYQSQFLDPAQRAFYRRIAVSDVPWLRFTRLVWNRRPIAFHFGFSYDASYLYYKPTFEIDLARRSPGQVMLRQLLVAATAEGCETFDLGLGAEPYKDRLATCIRTVRTWGLYPR